GPSLSLQCGWRSSAHLSKPVSGRLSKEINIAVSLLSKLCEREPFAAPVRELLRVVGKRCRLVRLLPLDCSEDPDPGLCEHRLTGECGGAGILPRDGRGARPMHLHDVVGKRHFVCLAGNRHGAGWLPAARAAGGLSSWRDSVRAAGRASRRTL